jgi:hypothetical protein
MAQNTESEDDRDFRAFLAIAKSDAFAGFREALERRKRQNDETMYKTVDPVCVNRIIGANYALTHLIGEFGEALARESPHAKGEAAQIPADW